MKVLSFLPTDGTFNQEAPIDRLAALHPMDVWSYDLKSATDRWPLSVIHDVVAFGPTLASCIVNGCLGLNTFYVGKPMVRRPNKGNIVSSWSTIGLLRLLGTVRTVTPLYCVVGSRTRVCEVRTVYPLCRPW